MGEERQICKNKLKTDPVFHLHYVNEFKQRQWKTRALFMSGLVFHSYLTFYLLFLFSTHALKKNKASALGLNLYQSV